MLISHTKERVPTLERMLLDVESLLKNIWPEWEIEGAIGSGGFGKVYKAVRKDTGAEAAIKIISIPENPSETERLVNCGNDTDKIRHILQTKADGVMNEIRVMQRLKGANNIVAIEDSAIKEKSCGLGFDIFIRMELLVPLKTHFSRKHVTEEDVVKLGCDICSALEICHKNMTEKRAIIHRDIKPDNILYHKISDSYKLGDFGISREITDEYCDCTRGTGTANFMAPEVATLKEYDTRADLYSLGLVLYYFLNRQKMPFVSQSAIPVPGEADIALRKRISAEKLDPPCDSSPQLTAVILKACAYSPNDRYSSATEMKQALQRANQSENILKNPAATATVQPSVETFASGTKPKKRKGVLTAAILALAVFAIIAGAKFIQYDFSSRFSDDSSDKLNTVGSKESSSDANSLGATDYTKTTTEEKIDPLVPSHETVVEPNTSKNHARLIELEQDQHGELSGKEHKWYKFATSNNNSAYRFGITKTETITHLLFPQIYVTIYDTLGIKIEEFEIHSDKEYAFIDLYLEPNAEYYIKTYLGGNFNEAKYELCVSEKPCDAGRDQETATELSPDIKNFARINSSLSNWHIFRAAKSGKYRITLHNIDVGCDIYLSVKRDEFSVIGISVENENHASCTIGVNEGENIYIEIYSHNNPVANGQYILVIEKEET